MSKEDIEKRYKLSHRIEVEEEIIHLANLIITSTHQEIKNQYGDYKNSSEEKFKVIPPGVDIEKFYPTMHEYLSMKKRPNLSSLLAKSC